MNDKDRTAIPTANMESDTGHESMAEKQAGTLDTRVNIRVISYRKRKHDPDGISVKAVLDGIVRAGILPDDSTKEVKKVSFESYKCKEGEEEKTIIEIREEGFICSFCGKSHHDVETMIAGPEANICSSCSKIAVEACQDRKQRNTTKAKEMEDG